MIKVLKTALITFEKKKYKISSQEMQVKAPETALIYWMVNKERAGRVKLVCAEPC